MDINNVISGILSVEGTISLVLEFIGFLSVIAMVILPRFAISEAG